MPLYVGKLFINCKNAGVSETYGISYGNILDADAALQQVASARQAMLAPDCTIIGTTTSNVDIRGDAIIGTGYPRVGTYDPESHPKTYDLTITDLYRETDPTFTHRALRHIRLIPDDQFDETSAFVPLVGWTTPRATFFGFLQTNTVILSKIKGAVAPPFYTSYVIQTALSERKSHKKVGRPFGQPVGRRPTR